MSAGDGVQQRQVGTVCLCGAFIRRILELKMSLRWRELRVWMSFTANVLQYVDLGRIPLLNDTLSTFKALLQLSSAQDLDDFVW